MLDKLLLCNSPPEKAGFEAAWGLGLPRLPHFS
jgi:hypothetical protein